MFNAFESPADFRNDTELSATQLQVLHKNVYALDLSASRDIYAPLVARERYWNPSINPHRIWWGGLDFRVGLTTLYVTILATTTTANENLRIYVNSSLVLDTPLLDGQNTYSATISSLGLLNKQVVDVDVQAYFPTGTNGSAAQYLLLEAYCTPTSALNPVPWGAPATFGSINTTNLNTLVNAEKHLANRIRVIPYPLQAQMFSRGGYWSTGDVTRLGYYVTYRTGTNTNFTGTAKYFCRQNQSSTLYILTNAAIFVTAPFFRNDQLNIDYNYSLASETINTPLWVLLQENISLGPTDWRGAVNTKYFNFFPRSRDLTYTAPTLPTETQMLESMTFSTLQSRLNTMGTAITSVYNKVVSNAIVFDRWPLFSRRPVLYDEHDQYYSRNWPFAKHRSGDILVVKGKNVRIATGRRSWESLDDAKYKFDFEEGIIDGDSLETVIINLNKYPNIPRGFAYYILGDYIHYAAEYEAY